MDAKRDRLDDYIVTIQELELVTGESIPVVEYLKLEKPEHSWMSLPLQNNSSYHH